MEITWIKLKEKRETLKKVFSSNILKIPLIYGTKKKIIMRLLENEKNKKLLDIGAGTKFLENFCLEKNIIYKSMDINTSIYYDYYSMDEINENFNIILLLDVIEHLSLQEGFSLLLKCYKILLNKGKIIITIPNIYHPNAIFSDCTHKTFYSWYDLAALVSIAGFKNLKIYRVSSKTKITHKVFSFLLMPFLRFLNIDYASGILIIGEK